MRITFSNIYISFCLLIAIYVALFMQSKGLGDVKQYIININALLLTPENLSPTSSKSYFYIAIFFASRWLGTSANDILYVISYFSYTGTLFLSIRLGRQRINVSIFFASFILLLSPFYIYFFMSNIRSGVSFFICLLSLLYFKKTYIQIVLLIASVLLHQMSLFIIFSFYTYYIANKIFGKQNFLWWLIMLGGASFCVILLLKSGYVSKMIVFNPWGAGSAYTISYLFALFMYCFFYWRDHPIWIAALFSLILAFFLFVVDIHAVRILSLAGVLCLCGTFQHDTIEAGGKYLASCALGILAIYHYYLILIA